MWPPNPLLSLCCHSTHATQPLACSTQVPNVLSIGSSAFPIQGGQLAACSTMICTPPCNAHAHGLGAPAAPVVSISFSLA
jgi:hypothetical protein